MIIIITLLLIKGARRLTYLNYACAELLYLITGHKTFAGMKNMLDHENKGNNIRL